MQAAPRRWLPFATAAVSAGAGAASLLHWATCGCTGLSAADAAIASGTGMLFVLVGTAAWLRPETARVGALLSAVGVTWWLRSLIWVPNPVAFTAGFLTANFCDVLLGHVVVAFPGGRLQGRWDRLVIGLNYGLYLPTRIVEMAFGTPVPIPPGASNLLLLRPDDRLAGLAVSAYSAFAIVMTLAVMAVAAGHWVRATPFGRRTLAPVIWACLLSAASTIALNVVGFDDSTLPLVLGLGAIAVGLLIGLIRTRLDHAGVGRLVIDLGERPASDLRGALARTLHDPSLTLAYWVPERAGYVDSDGRPVDVPADGAQRSVAVLRSGGRPVAALVHDAGLAYDARLLDATIAAARLVVERERFKAQLQDHLAEVRASRARILAAIDLERRRIESSLRSGAQLRLTAVSRALTTAQETLGAGHPPALHRALGEAVADVDVAVEELRALARGLPPAVLREAGLGPALESLAARQPLPVTIREVPRRPLPGPVEAAAYFVIAEALTNVAKHAGASAVSVTVRSEAGRLLAEVADDGIGGVVPERGSGLQGMADRATALDGRLEIVSPAGVGTVVRLELPVPPPSDLSSVPALMT